MTAPSADSQGSVLASKARVPDHVVYRTFVYETVVLNLKTGTYHGLNRTAGRMLDVLEKAPTVEAAAERLATEFGQPREGVLQDLAQFCVDLSERGLISLDNADTG